MCLSGKLNNLNLILKTHSRRENHSRKASYNSTCTPWSMHTMVHTHHGIYTMQHIHTMAHVQHGICMAWHMCRVPLQTLLKNWASHPRLILTEEGKYAACHSAPSVQRQSDTAGSQVKQEFIYFLTIYNLWSKTSWISEEVEGELTNLISSHITRAKAAIDPNGDHEGIRCLRHLTTSLTPNIFL